MNRPHLLEAAIKSVLWQSLSDFEIIVSDNSSEETFVHKNQAIVKRYLDDKRIRYVRPDTWMNMPTHWEFASRHALGDYVLILTDRHVMRPSALKCLSLQIESLQADAQVISWNAGSYFASGIVHLDAHSNMRAVLESRAVISDYAKCDRWRIAPLWINRLPRMLNSCYRRDVAANIRKKHGQLFWPISPDYTAAYLLLAYAPRMTYLDWPLFVSHGTESNGRSSLIYGDDKYISSLGDVEIFDGTPAPIRTITSSLVRDLAMVKKLVGDLYVDVVIDPVGYFMSVYRELLYLEQIGSLRDLKPLFELWRSGVEKLSASEKSRIREHLSELEVERVSFVGLRRVLVKWKLDNVYRGVRGAVRRAHRKAASLPIYEEVLEGALCTDEVVSAACQLHENASADGE